VSDVARRLARLRVPLGFAGAAAALWFAAPSRTTLAAGTLVALVGEAVRVWAAGHLNKSREVTASGPYRFVAHPLYVGSSIMGAGVVVAANSLIVAAIVALYLATTISAAIRSEEAFLRARFGDGYDRYRRGVVNRGARRFSIAQAIANREYRAVGGLLVAVLLLLWKATYNGSF
jgi:protein-S-isoprenylcysteine O-methyltransferase Ste14